jgi:DNA recombination protein RmuC
MDLVLIIAVIVLVGAVLIMLFRIFSMLQSASKGDRQILLESLQRNSESLNQRLDNTARVISDVQRNIGEMSEIGRSMRDLQAFLQSPKLRGNIGEHVLKDLISQIFPKSSFHLQYSFKSGEKVDAAIKTAAGILPIDSKFPMENFIKMNKAEESRDRETYKKSFVGDIKKHIVSISKKYILPDEGTMDFALMYIPSEPVYYEVVNDEELTNLAQKSRVYPVSPSTLYIHLQTILLSFEGQKIESHAKEVFRSLRAIQNDYSKIDENISVLQRHINNAHNMMANVSSDFGRLGQKIHTAGSLEEKDEKDKLLG